MMLVLYVLCLMIIIQQLVIYCAFFNIFFKIIIIEKAANIFEKNIKILINEIYYSIPR